jgi:hypothetical protein
MKLLVNYEKAERFFDAIDAIQVFIEGRRGRLGVIDTADGWRSDVRSRGS